MPLWCFRMKSTSNIPWAAHKTHGTVWNTYLVPCSNRNCMVSLLFCCQPTEKHLQLIRGPWKLIPGSLNSYLVDNYEIDKFVGYYFFSGFFVQLKMRAIEPELLKSNGGHRPQPTLHLLCYFFLTGPMDRVDTSQLVHACQKPLSCFFPTKQW